MNKNKGYKMTKGDIQATLRYLRTNEDKNATRKDAVRYLQEHQSLAHLAAHKIVADEKSGKIKVANSLNQQEKK